MSRVTSWSDSPAVPYKFQVRKIYTYDIRMLIIPKSSHGFFSGEVGDMIEMTHHTKMFCGAPRQFKLEVNLQQIYVVGYTLSVWE